jgi:cellulose synthase/poly-beta-1,6-N-acetylglucosamine synthase-like glycosyltransferase
MTSLKAWEQKHNMPLEHGYNLASSDESTNGEVTQLQIFLKEHHDKNHAITGVYDTKTEEAIKKWQMDHGVAGPGDEEFGVVGSLTREAIHKYSRTTPLNYQLKAPLTDFWSKVKREFEMGYLSSLATITPILLFFMEIVLIFAFIRIAFMVFILVYSFFFYRKRKRGSYDGGVSVIVPAYNEQENVASTIESILSNTWQKKEIIVIDDGSTDSTSSVVKEVQQRHPGLIRLFRIPNGGKANALNFGFRQATYEVVVALDGDTIFSETTIENLAHHFSNPNIGAVAGKVCVVEKERVLAIFQSLEYIIGQNIEKWAFSAINAVNVVPGPVGAWRKADVLAVGGYSVDTLVEDQDLTLSILRRGKKIVYDPDAVAYTETPPSVRDFIKQRFRWVFGTIQCFWKYRRQTFRKKNALSWVILPNIAIYGLVVPFFSPIIDILGISAILFGNGDKVMYAYLIFTIMDAMYASIAFRNEKRNLWMMLFLPFQRLFYRQIMYYIIIRSIVKAIEGTGALWNKVRRTGQAQKYFDKKNAAAKPATA